MKKAGLPSITTVVQAEPWEKGHVARFILRPKSNIYKHCRTISVGLLVKHINNDTNRE